MKIFGYKLSLPPFKGIYAFFYIGVLFLVSFLALNAIGFTLNMTKSLPRGVYFLTKARKNDIKKGDIVTFTLPPELRTMALERKYLHKSSFSSSVPSDLMKKVEGTTGDHVKINKEGVFINGSLLKNSAQRPADGLGQALPAITLDKVLEEGEYIMMSAERVKGFDARYYGIVTQDLIHRAGKPLYLID